MEALIKNGFNHKRSGDVAYIMEPSVISYPRQGSIHGVHTFMTHMCQCCSMEKE